MKVLQPILKSSQCDCDIETYLIYLDEYGLEKFECPLHGPPWVIENIGFDNMEEFMKWKADVELK